MARWDHCDHGLAGGRRAGTEIRAQAGHQEPPGEDQETPEVVLVQVADLPDELTVEGHLGYERTQAETRVKRLKSCRRWGASGPAGRGPGQALDWRNQAGRRSATVTGVVTPAPSAPAGTSFTRRSSSSRHRSGGVRRSACATQRSRRLG